VADNGSDMYVSGAFDPRWNNDILNPAFRSLTASDFEVVELGWRGTTSTSCAPPSGTPSPFSVSQSGRYVVLVWAAVAGATDYIVEAGAAAGATDVVVAPVGAVTSVGTAKHSEPRAVISRALGLGKEDLAAELERRMAAVQRIYQRIIHSEESLADEDSGSGEFHLRPPDLGGDVSYDHVLRRLADDSPALYEIASRRDLSARTRKNLYRFLSAAFTSSERYAAALRSPRAVERALRVFDLSDYLTDILVRYPEEIAALEELSPYSGNGDEPDLFPKTTNPALISTDDPDIVERVKLLGTHGQTRKNDHQLYGTNSRLDELHAAMLRVKLRGLDARNERRAEIATYYNARLHGLVVTPPDDMHRTHVYHQYVVRTPAREALRAHLTAREIETGVHYPVPIHRQPAWIRVYGDTPPLPRAEQAAQEMLSLPVHAHLTDAEVERVADGVSGFFGR